MLPYFESYENVMNVFYFFPMVLVKGSKNYNEYTSRKEEEESGKNSINMCSILNAMNQQKHHHDNSQSINISSEDDQVEWCAALSFVARLVAYIAILAVMVMVILLILKYITECGDESGNSEDVRAATESETDPLCPGKAIPYGTCDDDIETGSCSSGEDLYDGRICVICYDEQRNCFFVPCGHCATCYDCARRIYNEENKMCPVCRRVIGKVRKLFAP